MAYKDELRSLQIALTTFQRYLIEHGHSIVILFEGRDAAGKDGTIKRIIEHLSPRDVRTVALGVPSDRDRRSWYFQRYVEHLPAAREMVLFNRSWYNRAGVEKVMGFCTSEEHQTFMEQVLPFEELLITSGVQIIKYYLDISRDEQITRLQERRTDPLKNWKSSPIDAVAVDKWHAYSSARDEMLLKTGSDLAPWVVVDANDKKQARLNVIRDLLGRIRCPSLAGQVSLPDRHIVWEFKSENDLDKLF